MTVALLAVLWALVVALFARFTPIYHGTLRDRLYGAGRGLFKSERGELVLRRDKTDDEPVYERAPFKYLDRLRELANMEGDLPEDVQGEYDRLEADYAAHERNEDLNERRAKVAAATRELDEPIDLSNLDAARDNDGQGPQILKRNDPFEDLTEVMRPTYPTHELFARAETAVEETRWSPDDPRENLVKILGECDQGDQAARMAIVTLSDAYKSAFSKYLQRGTDARHDYSDAEREAWAAGQALVRAQSVGTDGEGGYFVPIDIDPTVTLTGDQAGPLYPLAKKYRTISDTYRNVQAPNASWSWDGENTEVSDDAVTFVNTDIPLYYAQGFVPVSIAAVQSIPGILDTVGDVLMGGYADLVGNALVNGTGSSQPTGFTVALTPTASATTDVFAEADVRAIFEGVGAKTRSQNVWFSGMTTLGLIMQMEDGGSTRIFTDSLAVDKPASILGRPWYEDEDMDDVINATQTNEILAFINPNYYVVAEAIGTLVEYVPQVFGTTGRPIGARGIYAATRFGCDSVWDAAHELLDVT